MSEEQGRTTLLAEQGSRSSYGELLTAPGAPRLALSSLVSKIPVSMFPVSVLLLLSPRYSYASAGLAVSVMLVASAISAPVRGRIVTRHPVRSVLLVCLAGYLVGVTGLVLSALKGLPLELVLGSAGLIGLSYPPVVILVRTYWIMIAGERARPTASALESALMDATLVTGPVLAAWLSTSDSAVLPFIVLAALMAAAVTLLPAVGGSNDERAAGRSGHWSQPLRSGPLLAVFGAEFLFCAALTAVELSLPIYAQQQHVTRLSGVYLTELSVGSIAGALVLGASSALSGIGLPTLLGTFAFGTCLLGLAMHVTPVAVLCLCPLTGLAIGSTFSRLYTAIGAFTPAGSDHETQGWANSITTAGFAVGGSVGAVLAGAHGASAFLFLSPLAGAVALLLTLAAVSPTRGLTASQDQ